MGGAGADSWLTEFPEYPDKDLLRHEPMMPPDDHLCMCVCLMLVQTQSWRNLEQHGQSLCFKLIAYLALGHNT